MTDIVERLRSQCSPFAGSLVHDAADEIERLRREVNLLQEQRPRLARGTAYTTAVENEVERLRQENERLRAEVYS